jgi:hypothetical protein
MGNSNAVAQSRAAKPLAFNQSVVDFINRFLAVFSSRIDQLLRNRLEEPFTTASA